METQKALVSSPYVAEMAKLALWLGSHTVCRTCGGQGVERGAVFLGYVLSLAGVHDTQGLHLRLCSGVPSLEQKGNSSMEDVDSGYLAPWSVPRSRSDTGIEAV